MSKTHLLIIDTAAEICSVSVSRGDVLIHSEENQTPNSHASSLTILIEKCMTFATIDYRDLQAICVHQGPGSYTGLRIGVSVAKGICYAYDIPLIGIDGLFGYGQAYLAQSTSNCDAVMVAIDARRDEVYGAIIHRDKALFLETQPIIIDQSFLAKIAHFQQLDVLSNCPDKLVRLMNVNNITIDRHFQFSARYLNKYSYKMATQNFENNLAYFEPNYMKNSYIKKT